jgi:hypothetical protein
MACAALIGACSALYAQDWNTGGNFISGPTQYLGCDALSTQPLRFTTKANYPHEWRTNDTLRMRLLGTQTGQTIGIYTNENLTGNVGIGTFDPDYYVTRPFSLLHLDNGGSQYSGYRPWFKPGMTITSGSDLAWIGLKNEGGDTNHLTLAWADNANNDGPDVFKVVFLANPTTTGTAGTLNGLETMRILPASTGLESYIGIGDWFTAATNPTERLDVLDGRVRVRQLPTDPEANTLDQYMVV